MAGTMPASVSASGPGDSFPGSLVSSPRFFPVLLVLAGLLAYGNSFGGAFVFDDQPSILTNMSLRSLLGSWFPPDNLSTSGRPVVNFSLAVSQFLGGGAADGFHLVNLLIHLGAGLLLYGLLRRTLGAPLLGGRFAGREKPLAFAAALLWLVHPLTTEAVTYIVQRAESLAAFFCLATLYALVRAEEASDCLHAARWRKAAVAACLGAMGSKEAAAALPLLAFLFDRAFLSGTFAVAWRRRKGFYLALAATWIVLLVPILTRHGRGDSVGLVKAGLAHSGIFANATVYTYALTQAKAVLLYLGLAFWPAPLVFDYGYELLPDFAAAWPYVAGVALLLGVTVWAVVRRPAAGFLGVLVFAVLAPSSSFLPIQTQTMAEHRFYLPLAAVAVGVVLLLHAVLKQGRWVAGVAALVAVPLAVATHQRNQVYASSLALWADTAAKRPDNPRAQCNLGAELAGAGDDLGAIFRYRAAIRLRPDMGEAHDKLGASLYRTDHAASGMAEMEQALAICPADPLAQSNYGAALLETGHPDEALDHLAEAVALEPTNATYHYNFGNALNRSGKPGQAADEFVKALSLKPDYVEAHNNLGIVLFRLGKRGEAQAEFEAVLRLDPKSAEARINLARLKALEAAP